MGHSPSPCCKPQAQGGAQSREPQQLDFQALGNPELRHPDAKEAVCMFG